MSTFSESWYRVANQRICLRPGIHVRRQNFRGERWIVLENPFSNQYFRLRPAAYEFVVRLRPDRTVEEVWKQCLERFPDEAPSQEAVIQLLAQLYFANLLQYDLAADSAQLFERYKKRRQRELGFRFLNIMFMRFPLLDPDRFLVRTLPVIGRFISPVGALLWLAVVGMGLKVAIENAHTLWREGEGVLAQGNLFLLFLALVLIKTLHEFGHAYFCRKFGGEVHVMGVMLMIFTPLPYVDATSSWSFRERWKRLLVGGAGMIVEVFFAAIAVFIWASTGPGLLHNLAYNVMFIASISTLLINLNPLLRFDGYYMLSDLLEIPNLNQRANSQLRHLCERYLFGVRKSDSPAANRREVAWFTTYGITSGIYRVILFTGILFAIADRFLIIGLVMAAICLVSWVTVPVIRFVRYLATSPRLDRVRPRAVGVSAAFAVVLLILLGVVPFPHGFRAPGVVKTTERTMVANETGGRVEAVFVESGSPVKRGQPLLQLQNPELALDLADARARLAEVSARLLKATSEESADIAPLKRLQQSTVDRIEKLMRDTERLTIRAPHDGLWVSPHVSELAGRWFERGRELGLLANPESFEFVATVMQEDVDALFGEGIKGANVRLYGDVGKKLPITRWRVVPAEQNILPSAALGWKAGGEVPVAVNDENPSRTAEPYFQVLGALGAHEGVALLDGRSGKIRFALEPEPLLPRWFRRLWQLLQKRYQI